MYINSVLEENKNNYILRWLLLITILVALMITIGGLTRLTGSGLSITKWDLFSGIIPPLTLKNWEKAFFLYKQIPEYYLENSDMTLDEFKIIFWWEYIHRLLGRFIGILYILPLFYFTFKKKLKKNTLISLYSIFLLIFIQGFIGWYMVKSGLTERTDVSHYRLSLHLILAFIIFILLLWNFLKYKYEENFTSYLKLPKYIPILFIIVVLFQIFIGALVSGLDAGQIYKSWPLMDSSYYPDDSEIKNFFSLNSFETPSIVQFIHRNMAYIIFVFYLLILYKIFENKGFVYLRNTSLLIFTSLIIQIFLGVLTILSGAQIIFASLHQIGSIFLVTTSLILVFKNSKIN
ncbi:COX15/CtaA family protein [Pelagibacteraceae bacterium]|nr:COX15/CtaA family protein [Pelagibacteraceae bacterium]